MPENAEILKAIEVVKRYLDEEWITEGCLEHQAFGCASCRAIALRQELTLLADDLIDAALSPEEGK